MVWSVIRVDPQNPMITRDYAEYITSNSLLLGAEFNKVILIAMVTGILAIAPGRALLVSSVLEGSAAEDLSKFVPREVARQVKFSEQRMDVGFSEVREATILFTDIEGFTSISENMEPTELIATLNAYFNVISRPIERHGGGVNEFQGDTILATFNVPDELEDHAAEALRATVFNCGPGLVPTVVSSWADWLVPATSSGTPSTATKLTSPPVSNSSTSTTRPRSWFPHAPVSSRALTH